MEPCTKVIYISQNRLGTAQTAEEWRANSQVASLA